MSESNKYNAIVFFKDPLKHRVTYHKIHSIKKFVAFIKTKEAAFIKVYNRYTNEFLGNICIDENLANQKRFAIQLSY
jgi:hypothetical protein